MGAYSYYESVMKEFMPAIKAGIAKELSKKYGLTQIEISKKLGVTQAEVSKYLAGIYSDKLKKFEAGISAKSIESITKNVVEKNDYDAQKEICKVCNKSFHFDCSLMIK
jgi:predicted transcriptional regulator